MTWSQRRQFTYFFSIFIVLAAIAYAIISHATHVEPTCYDGKKNGDEVGVDCGGSCAFYCKAELSEPKIRWTRFFTIAPGIIHAISYVEHTHPNAAAEHVAYTFNIYDEKNNILTSRSGTTYIGPMGRSAIVETLIPVGNTIPALARLTFDDDIVWSKISPEFSKSVIKTDRFLLEPFEGGTRLTSTLDNQSRISFKGVDVVAILYNKSDNAIAVSKSVVDIVPAQKSTTVYFTWPSDLKRETARVEIIPRINPFNVGS